VKGLRMHDDVFRFSFKAEKMAKYVNFTL
jgi:hypothetical protein